MFLSSSPSPFQRRLAVCMAGLTLAAAVVPAMAQDKPSVPPPASDPYAGEPDPYAPPPPPPTVEDMLRARGEAYHRAPDSEQNPEELARTQALNAEITARNDAAAKAEADAQADYDAAQARFEEETARAQAERLNYEENLRAAEAAQAQYERDKAAWEDRVRACNSGVRSACGPAY